jgi:hypothetical protein
MSYLEHAIADRYAKLTGDPNNDIQPVSREALIGAIKKCHQTLWAGGKFGDADQFRNAVNQLQPLPYAA